MRAKYDSYSREGFRETPASLVMTLRELKAHLPDLTWAKVNLKAFDIMTSMWRSVPALKQSLDAGFHQLKDIAVLRQSHRQRKLPAVEDNINNNTAPTHGSLSSPIPWSMDVMCELNWSACETPIISARCASHALRQRDAMSFMAPTTGSALASSARPCTSTTPVVAVEAAEAEDEAVAVVVVDADEAMGAHLEADGDRAGTLGAMALTTSLSAICQSLTLRSSRG
eukprot:jgi/Tetstr1/428092/TSEL_018147.t1